MSGVNENIEQWDRYWSYGNIHSFSQVSGGNYQGVIAAFWQRQFSELAPGCRILDIATGNGAIPLLALQESDRLDAGFGITGVDLADIDPAAGVKDESMHQPLARIRFLGRIAAESLPFPEHSFDFVCSQFGLEYSDLSKSIPEALRVLSPGGRMAVVSHRDDSMLLRAARDELDQLGFVLDEVKLYLRARNLLRAMQAGGGVKLEKKQRALEQAMARISDEAGRRTSSTMLRGPARYIQEIFSATGRATAGELLGWLEEAQARVDANRRRLLDMTDAALGPEELDSLVGRLRSAGASTVVVDPLEERDGAPLGWCISSEKGGA